MKIQAQVESLCQSIVRDESEDTGWGQTERLNLTSECQVSNVQNNKQQDFGREYKGAGETQCHRGQLPLTLWTRSGEQPHPLLYSQLHLLPPPDPNSHLAPWSPRWTHCGCGLPARGWTQEELTPALDAAWGIWGRVCSMVTPKLPKLRKLNLHCSPATLPRMC